MGPGPRDAAIAPAGFTLLAATTLGPLLLIALAGLALRLPLAAAHPAIAMALFGWIVADSLLLALIARSSGRKPAPTAVLAVLAGAAVTFLAGLPAAMRGAVLAQPALVSALAVPLLGQGAVLVRRAWRAGSARAALAATIPAPLLRLARAELTVLHMALLRWGGPPDVPPGAAAFAYHRHLAPMAYALLVLSAIEVAVYHLLIGHFSRTAAIVLFVLSDVGLIYLIGLIKSFRYRPVLIEAEGVRIRAGLLIDRFVPFAQIAALEAEPAGDKVRDPATLNAALLAWPNLLLRLAHPQPPRSALRRTPVTAIAFRLDDPAAFVAALDAAQARGGWRR